MDIWFIQVLEPLAVKNILVMFPGAHLPTFEWNINLGVKLLDYRACISSIVLYVANCFPKWLYHFASS
jgi:hypothetical protein